MTVVKHDPIAIVGIGCRFPGDITSAKGFWDALCRGLVQTGDIPAERFDSSSFCDQDPRKYGSIKSNKGGFLRDITAFDADFFGIYPAEASRMDPQQRLALEASVHAIEDSGTTLQDVEGTRTGVFFGHFLSDHVAIQTTVDQRDNLSPHVAMGISNCSIANRVSHRLDLQGPSLTVDTACSSSLVALHLACQSIWSSESDTALAGGVNAILRPESNMVMSKAGFLSKDGTCKSFDASADGYVRSEGVGAVYLKPLRYALRDKDRVYAVVRGSLVNQDGHTLEGFTVPSLKAQTTLLQSLYHRSAIDVAKVWYVEAHGPGTVVGDPIEANALGGYLGRARTDSDQDLWIGSLKGNFGHLEGAAGIAGFIKAALIAFHKIIPPQANHKTPNPSIDFQSLRLKIPLENVQASPLQRVLVGVNSFGAGGTNAHAILEGLTDPAAATPVSPSRPAHVFLLSARSAPALQMAATELASHIRHERPALNDVAYTLNMRRTQHQHTAVISASCTEDLCSQLDKLASAEATKDVLTIQRRSNLPPKIAFVFSGQGGQWLGMGASLMQREPVFRQALEAFDNLFESLAGFSVIAEISVNADSSRLNQTYVVQPAIAAVQIGIARMLMSYGVEPDAITGHSIGEVAAAHVAGALTLWQAVQVIYLRSSIQSKAAGTGSMLAVGLSLRGAEEAIARHKLQGSVEVAALNGPKLSTISGNTTDLETLADRLNELGIFARSVNVEVPYHSRFMDPLKAELVQSLSAFRGSQTEILLYSTVSTAVEPGTHLTGEYWFENVRKPVRYTETVARMLEDGYNFLIEIGPHPVLVSGTREIADGAKLTVQAFPTMVRGNDIEPLARLLGAAKVFGIGVDIDSYNGGGGSFIDLPLYPFQRKSYWFEHPEASRRRIAYARHPFLGDATSLTDDQRTQLRLRLSTGALPFLAEHVVDNALIFPMTGHLEAAYLAAKECLAKQDGVWLQDIQFNHPVILQPPEEFAPQVMLEVTSSANDYVVASRPADSASNAAWQMCSRGRMNHVDSPPNNGTPGDMNQSRTRIQAGVRVDAKLFYKALDRSGLRYGDAFRAIQGMWRLGDEIFSHVQLPSVYHGEAARFRFHPALLDACLHSLFADVHHFGDAGMVFLPYHVKAVQIFDANGAVTAYSHILVTSRDDDLVHCNATIYGEDGQTLAVATGLTMKRVKGRRTNHSPEHRICFQPESSQTIVHKRAEVEFANILLLDLHLAGSQWSLPLIKAFPNASLHRANPCSVADSWNDNNWRFQLDRRALVVFTAITTNDHNPDMALADFVFSTLLRISRWIYEQRGACTFIVLTKGGAMTPVDSQCDPLASSIEAAVRVMGIEFPRARIRVVDLSLDEESQDIALLDEEFRTIRLGREDTMVAIRTGQRFFRTIVAAGSNEDDAKEEHLVPARGGSYCCERDDKSASLGGVLLQEKHLQVPGPNDVAIEVHAAGLNFKDVMNGLNLLGGAATAGGLASQQLGLEVAGRIVEKGAMVNDVDIGTMVMARVSRGLAGRVVVNHNLTAPIPSSLSPTEAACVPVAYITAYYALVYLGRLAPGESVLIHSAAGGVGMAAVHIAKLFGSRVYGTASNASRRAKVLELGVEAVFDSRSPSFHDEIKKATGGLGVDLVLNSLSGPLFLQSIRCLAPFGRFLEIGKTDIYRNMRLGLEQLGDNCSFYAVDVDRLALQRPKLHHRMLTAVHILFENGQLPPPQVTRFPITKLSEALKLLSSSNAIGKIAVEMPENAQVQVAASSTLKLRSDRSYLITGGTSGLGLHIGAFLVERGARHLILASRSGTKTGEDEAIIVRMKQKGANITITKVDVSDAASVAELFEPIRGYPPIVGVVHCAGVVQDAMTYENTMTAHRNVFQPKALGAWNLHAMSRSMNLDMFVMISSVSSAVGGAGKFSYAAANQFLDSLAHHRRGLGLAGLALNLGVLGDYAGMLKKTVSPERILEDLEMQGMSRISLPAVLSLFERTILRGETQRLAMSIDFSIFLKSYPHFFNNGLYSQLGSEREGVHDAGDQASMHKLSPQERVAVVADTLRTGLASIVGLEPSQISITEKIDQYGSDSLTLTQLRGVIIREFNVTFSLIRLFQGPTLEEIAVELHETFYKGGSSAQSPTNSIAQDASEFILGREFSTLSPGLIQGTGGRTGKLVVCFHAMGGGASQFYPFLSNCPEGISISAVQLPGRENRADEPIPGSLTEAVAGILSDLDRLGGPPDLFWGHSLGGIIAFEVIRALRRQGKQLPRLLITSTIAPQLARCLQRREQFLQMAAEDCSPEYVLATTLNVEGADFGRSILPMTRKDAPLLAGYEYHEEEMLNLPIFAVAGREDDIVYQDEVAGWKAQCRQFKMMNVEGGHWSLQRNEELLWKAINDLLSIQVV
ncbi:hypothetical protein NQ176_g5785 [Zarea fungicola]|uniref:Uncharacterized protein n=1 Tax=Zarea fungicola TaxID=93591 RepID=A0ACC1N934_9HYPO|nr:hypothetical protein NQ176_g5785 [Lecanicillium fungicola]